MQYLKGGNNILSKVFLFTLRGNLPVHFVFFVFLAFSVSDGESASKLLSYDALEEILAYLCRR